MNIKIAVLTGAGISAKNGYPLFAGPAVCGKIIAMNFLAGKAGEILPALANRTQQV